MVLKQRQGSKRSHKEESEDEESDQLGKGLIDVADVAETESGDLNGYP